MHLKAKILLNKRVEQECAHFTNEANSSESIKVWIYTTQEASIAGSNDFRLLTSAILSNPLSFQFLLERNYWQQDAYGNISCVFRQKSGQTSSRTANGLEAVYSPYFYITKEVSNFSKIIKPFLSYIWSENILIVLPVFKERDETAKNIQLFLQFEGWQYTVVSVMTHLLWILFTLYNTYFLTYFVPNISKVEIPEIHVNATHPDDKSENGEWTVMEEDFIKVWLDKQLLPLRADSGVPSDFDDDSEAISLLSPYYSDPVGRGTEEEPCIEPIHSSPENTASEPKAVTSFQHYVRPNSDRIKNSVCVIQLGGDPSQVGLRSFVATKLQRYRLINFVFWLSAPVFVFLLVDITFVLLPGLVLKVDTPSLPSASMTESVLLHVYEYPYLLMLLFFYCLRILGLCILQSFENRVPCFSCRKHLLCFIGRNYITQFCPRNCLQIAVCNECKNVDCSKQCEFHVFSNIKYHVDSQPHIPKKNWKDIKDAFAHNPMIIVNDAGH